MRLHVGARRGVALLALAGGAALLPAASAMAGTATGPTRLMPGVPQQLRWTRAARSALKSAVVDGDESRGGFGS